MPAEVGCVLGHDDDVRRARVDFLLATRAKIGLAGLGAVDAPHFQAESGSRSGQVRYLLEFFELQRGSARPRALASPPWSWAHPSIVLLAGANSGSPGASGDEPGKGPATGGPFWSLPRVRLPPQLVAGTTAPVSPAPNKRWLVSAVAKWRCAVLATVCSATLLGVDGHLVNVEVHASNGLPGFRVVGLPDASCREARDRVRAALLSSGFRWPQRRITVNLAPSGLRKVGSGLDVAIALGVLSADGQLAPGCLTGRSFLGELGLDGALRRIPGVLPLVGTLRSGDVIVPMACAGEARLVAGERVRTASTLKELVGALLKVRPWPEPPHQGPPPTKPLPDLAEMRGQAYGRQVLEVAAAGGHHLLLVGAAGAGKTMLAVRLPGLLPPLSADEALEVAKVHSAAGLELSSNGLDLRPPLRAPHHSASAVSLIGGGGSRLRPGEISCAHHGVLFMDELAEFPAAVLDNLRQPLEEGRIVVSRASAAVAFPARFILVAAMNACRCGADGAQGSCQCGDAARARYLNRVSGPLLDRFDLRARVHRPNVEDLLCSATGSSPATVANEPSSAVARRVADARRRASARGVKTNAQLPSWRLDEAAPLSSGGRRVLERRLREGRLSARGLDRVRRVALTLADLAKEEGPLSEEHVTLALAMRSPGIFGRAGDDPLGGLFGSSAATGIERVS